MAPSRRGEGAGGTGAPGLTAANSPDGGLVAVMEQKRNAHDQAIKVSIGPLPLFPKHCWFELDLQMLHDLRAQLYNVADSNFQRELLAASMEQVWFLHPPCTVLWHLKYAELGSA